jgi:hypothetical protein
MSNEIEVIKDPGLPAHKLRQTDIDPKAAARAEHELAVALFQVARDCFDPATRSPVGSK